MHAPFTRLTVAAAAALLLVGAACGDDEDEPTVAPTTPVVPGPAEEEETPESFDVPPIASASDYRTDLLGVAEEGAGAEPGDDGSFGVVQAWSARYPAIDFVGYALDPDEETVPVYAGPINSKQPASLENPNVVIFVVRDRSGGCAGGVASGFPTLTAFDDVDMAGIDCTVSAAAERWAELRGFTFA